MRKIMTLARRELSAYFYSPIAYVIAALLLLPVAVTFLHGWGVDIPFLGISRLPILRNGGESTLRPMFDMLAKGAMVIIVPLMTMRLVAEEFRSGTIEPLMTAPVTDTQVICGKFLGAFWLYLVLLAMTLVFLPLLIIFGKPDYLVVATGYLGLILLGLVYVSVGVFASTLTRHQVVAGLIAMGLLAMFTVGAYLLVTKVPPEYAPTMAKLYLIDYFTDFSKGFLGVRSVALFASSAAFFLFLSVKVLESRRWR